MSEGFVGSEVIRINLLSQQPLDESIQKLVNDNPRNVKKKELKRKKSILK